MAKQERQLSALDRAVQMAMGEGRQVGHEDDPAKETWPNLWAWLTQVEVGKDYIVQPASISLQAVVGGVQVSVSNRDLAISCRATTKHLHDAFNALEAVCGDPAAIMSSWGRKEPTLRKRRKT